MLAARRLEEAAGAGGDCATPQATASATPSSFADLARPPVLGLVEPERELDRVLTELAALDKATA